MYHHPVIRRLYVHNFKCLENFDLPIGGRSSVLLIGKNGAGKTTVGFAIEILQKIARGTNRVGELVKPGDLPAGRPGVPMRFELEVELDKRVYAYSIAFEFPEGFRELRVLQESLAVDALPIFSRELAEVHLRRNGGDREAAFFIDWHLVALPIIQQRSTTDPVSVFKDWLSRILVLRPIPSLISGHSEGQTLRPNATVTDIGAWFGGIMSHAPAAYARVSEHLKQVMPDLEDITNPKTGPDSQSLVLQFAGTQGNIKIPFAALSDGEKCFVISALVLAANKAYGPILCFWDEPDNYLAPAEVGHFVVALRRTFQPSGQFIATSHNTEAIRRFSDENTLVLHRNSHIEPTVARTLDQVQHQGDLISSLVRGDLEI